MRLAAIGTALALIVISPTAGANSTQDGNFMLSMCEHAFDSPSSDALAAHSLVCLSFVHASYYTAILVRDIGGNAPKSNFCGKPGLTNGQLARIFVKWLSERPERLNEPAVFLAYEAWKSAYPCRAPLAK